MGSRALRFTILILVARIVSRLLALVAVVAIGNALGDTRFGEMHTALTYTALVAEIVPETAVILGMALIGAHIHAGPGLFLWAYVAASGFAAAYFIVVLLSTRILAPRWQLEPALFRGWIGAGIPLAITYLLTTVY